MMQSFSHASQPAASVEPLAPASSSLQTALGCLLLFLPVVICLSVSTHRRHRRAKLRRQVQMLEKLWLLNAPKLLP